MATYYFTNRRRAKDAVMLLVDEHATDGLTVFISEGVVYLDFDPVHVAGNLTDSLGVVLHYAETSSQSLSDIFTQHPEKITELYRGEGLIKFRV